MSDENKKIDNEQTENPAPTRQELAAKLLGEYQAIDDEANRLKKMLDEVNRSKSDACKKLYDAFGKGPFTYRGNYLGTIVVRNDTYFFRGKNHEGSIKVD